MAVLLLVQDSARRVAVMRMTGRERGWPAAEIACAYRKPIWPTVCFSAEIATNRLEDSIWPRIHYSPS